MELGEAGEEGGGKDLSAGSEVEGEGRRRREQLCRLMWRKTVRSNLQQWRCRDGGRERRSRKNEKEPAHGNCLTRMMGPRMLDE